MLISRSGVVGRAQYFFRALPNCFLGKAERGRGCVAYNVPTMLTHFVWFLDIVDIVGFDEKKRINDIGIG